MMLLLLLSHSWLSIPDSNIHKQNEILKALASWPLDNLNRDFKVDIWKEAR